MTIHWLIALGTLLTLSAPQAGAGDIAAGETRYAETCVTCHGRTGRGLGSFPSIKGRDVAYVVERLTQYRAGERVGPNSMLMIPMAAELSDAEITDLAAYVATAFR